MDIYPAMHHYPPPFPSPSVPGDAYDLPALSLTFHGDFSSLSSRSIKCATGLIGRDCCRNRGHGANGFLFPTEEHCRNSRTRLSVYTHLSRFTHNAKLWYSRTISYNRRTTRRYLKLYTPLVAEFCHILYKFCCKVQYFKTSKSNNGIAEVERNVKSVVRRNPMCFISWFKGVGLDGGAMSLLGFFWFNWKSCFLA